MTNPRADQFSTLAEVSHAVASILDLDTLLHEVVTIIRRKVDDLGPRSAVHLYIVDPVRQKIVFRAGSGPGNQRFRGTDDEQGLSYDLNPPPGQGPTGIIPWVARHCQTVLANNVELDARYRPLSDFVSATTEPGILDATASELTVPLAFRNEVLGVLDVQSDHQDAFGQEDRLLFEALADSVAIAIRNANLYHSERWRRKVADSLHQVAGLLSADVMLEEVLDTVLVELERTLPCDLAAIWLLEEDELHLPAVRISAHRVPATPRPNSLEAQDSEEHGPTKDDNAEPVVLDRPIDILSTAITPAPDTWLGHALDAERPVIRTPDRDVLQSSAGPQSAEPRVERHPISAPDPLAEILGFPADHSAIAAPLRAGSQRLGLLTLSHREPDRYGEESRVILTTFASYAAVAIENARLFQEAQEQALISTVMLQVAKVSQSFGALDQVLGAVAELTSQLVSVDRCAILLWDQPDLAFLPGAAWGLDPTQESLFDQAHLSAGQVPALDDLLVTRAPAVLSTVEQGRAAAGEHMSTFKTENWLAEIGFECLLLLPLLSQGMVQGAMLIECHDDFFVSSGSDGTDLSSEGSFSAGSSFSTGGIFSTGSTFSALLDQRLVILQGIAYQAATAVENARLREAQEAEAYVSAALLQVSQAINNLHDLDEILEAIARMTPILIGVELCLIFLWEEKTNTFRLAQAYGVSQDQHVALSRETYPHGEFGLLHRVRDQNQPATYTLALPQVDEGPLPEGWQEHLGREHPDVRSLLAVPLAVKDDVLGVMLLAEPHRASDRLRPHYFQEKRLEIISGIAHQAALTVQNERLQQARLSSERLERELELAREIQRTFIPDSRLVEQVDSGWDIAVEWRAARHVAGDFYDLIELPGKRLGLIVADVADKGMPAALLMALTRTLLRATALEESSPGAVLARVNNLLVPDAKRGMFVTAAYATLCLESGQLTYANAGHCLPLIQTGTGQLDRLPKGGMALGVVAGLRFEDHTAELAPGDRLVLYTDGITEAFSPQGDIYGEARLLDVLTSHTDCAAQTVLDAILASVYEFTHNAPPTDDLTLLVLRRALQGAER